MEYPKTYGRHGVTCLILIGICYLAVCVYPTRGQIDDIILDLEDPEDYEDEVMAFLEREQAEKQRKQMEAAARCRVRCLANKERDHGGPNSSYGTHASLERCLRDDFCTACMMPCSQPFETLDFCRHQCQADIEATCVRSCRFLQSIYIQRPGQCPMLQDLTQHGAVCIDACLVDSDCPQDEQKCCHNGCGHACVQPRHTATGVPNVPDQPQLTEIPSEGAILLDWNSVSNNYTGPVLYIVWVRWNVGKHHSDAHVTHWQQVKQTTETREVIRDISPGHWYQYQVSAVNINGSQGASPPTRPYCLATEPSPPSVPINMTEGSILVQGTRVTVSVQWRAPLQSDLPVTRYKIFWSKRLSNIPINEDIQEFRHVIDGDQVQFDVPDLDPESTYLLQVQAICQYGDTRLKSEKATIYINTYPLSRAEHIVLTTTMLSVEVENLPTPPPVTGIKVESPFFQNGLLRANVSWSVIQDGSGVVVQKALLQWSPEACIADSRMDNGLPKLLTASTQDQHFVIYELRFDCRYVVKVSPVSDQGAMGLESRMSFVTPSCGEVPVVGMVQPDCPSSVPRVPEEPANLHHSFVINAVNISAVLTWDPPLSDSPIDKYRVTWGQTLQDNPKVWDKNTILTKVLEKDLRRFQLENLCEAVTYLVRIQALSRIGAGKVATVHFTAPVLTVTTPRATHLPSVRTRYQIINADRPNNEPVRHQPGTTRPHSANSAATRVMTSPSCTYVIISLLVCCLATVFLSESVATSRATSIVTNRRSYATSSAENTDSSHSSSHSICKYHSKLWTTRIS